MSSGEDAHDRRPPAVVNHDEEQSGGSACCSCLLVGLSVILIIFTFPFSLCVCIKVRHYVIASQSNCWKWNSQLLCFLPIIVSISCVSVQVVQQYERAVIYRLGRLLSGGAKGPGGCECVVTCDMQPRATLTVEQFVFNLKNHFVI